MAELRCSDGTVVKISKETEAELRRQFGRKEPEFGDIVEHWKFGFKRVVLYDAHGELQVYSISHCRKPYMQTVKVDYTPTGQNIFKDNLLDLTRN